MRWESGFPFLDGSHNFWGSVAKLAEVDAGLISGFFKMYKFQNIFQSGALLPCYRPEAETSGRIEEPLIDTLGL